jgi:hypothetical protein
VGGRAVVPPGVIGLRSSALRPTIFAVDRPGEKQYKSGMVAVVSLRR